MARPDALATGLPAAPPVLPSSVDVSVLDVVVAAGLALADTTADAETSIAVDPEDPQRIAIAAFSGGWGDFAPLWISRDGGSTWRRRRSLPAPPGGAGIVGCPCDQTFDYGRSHRLYGAALAIDGGNRPTYVGATSDPSRAAAWAWPLRNGVTRRANPTAESDQPWISTGPDPTLPDADLVYVGYTDYGADPPANHVAVLRGEVPPRRLRDRVVATSPRAGSLAAAALRVAADPIRGTVYALWQDPLGVDAATCARRIDLRLGRSRDGGETWETGSDGRGFLVAHSRSFQGRNDDPRADAAGCRGRNQKFGGVNALLGGAASLTTDPTTGDALVAFVDLGGESSAQQLISLVRVSYATGTAIVERPVTAGGIAALPAVAVAANGTVGVLYDTFDGSDGHYPRFTTHLAQSADGGVTFADRTLVSFVSPARSNAHAAQRVLGDYQQLRAVGDFFLAAFPANGRAFGRTVSSIDPCFARVRALGRAP